MSYEPMDMPSPCPTCGEIFEHDDMVNHPNEYTTLVCEDCAKRIEDENNTGFFIDEYKNRIDWESYPDDGLVEFKIDGEEITTWANDSEPDLNVSEFEMIWRKAQSLVKG